MISTRLSPGACGIGAYSLMLRKHWPNDAARPLELLVVEGKSGADGLHDCDRVAEFAGSGERLRCELDRIGAADVLLQYAGRAYHRLGAPLWMPRVFKRWKRQYPNSRLMIFAHELPGDLSISSRHYWLGQLNSYLIRQLASVSDVLATNTEHHAAKLQSLSGRADVHVVPIGSNIEVAPVQPAVLRSPSEFVVFGLPFGRLQTLQTFQADVRRWHSSGKLTKLHVIGPQDDAFSREANELMSGWPKSIEIIRHGTLPSAEVSTLLQRARFALTNVSDETWSKSGAFIAAATHGCVVVVARRVGDSPPLANAITAEEFDSISDAEIERRAGALARWAAENASWPVIARRIASLLQTGVTSNGG